MMNNHDSLKLLEPASPETLIPDHGLWPWLLAAVLLSIIVICILKVIQKKSKPANSQTARFAAFQEACTSLTDTTTPSARDAAVRCSLILRRYLATAVGDPALYETHEEFISRHDSLTSLKPEARDAAEAGFSQLAALKYAPGDANTPATDVFNEARKLLETLHQGFAA